ncbi:uncharacterized protein LOC132406689 [Hypanus sabinus]|uniref:uncharacterized protein LOC132406689 n=1 Tax=Hypanus sabinus TaxID=79690 RepID=UPI0028C4D651|nr:uncharacterized protein LOC132406689 [Hypanus sabinus]
MNITNSLSWSNHVDSTDKKAHQHLYFRVQRNLKHPLYFLSMHHRQHPIRIHHSFAPTTKKQDSCGHSSAHHRKQSAPMDSVHTLHCFHNQRYHPSHTFSLLPLPSCRRYLKGHTNRLKDILHPTVGQFPSTIESSLWIVTLSWWRSLCGPEIPKAKPSGAMLLVGSPMAVRSRMRSLTKNNPTKTSTVEQVDEVTSNSMAVKTGEGCNKSISSNRRGFHAIGISWLICEVSCASWSATSSRHFKNTRTGVFALWKWNEDHHSRPRGIATTTIIIEWTFDLIINALYCRPALHFLRNCIISFCNLLLFLLVQVQSTDTIN